MALDRDSLRDRLETRVDRDPGARESAAVPSGIGLLNEKPLHASLKSWYARPGDRFEVAVNGFVIDIVRGDLLIEIQTGNFAAIRLKLARLLRSHRVRLIYPIARERWIVRLAANGGGRVSRRRSPRKGRLEDVFRELVSIPRLLSNRNFSVEVLMIREEEERRYEGKRQWRRGGWAIDARRMLEVVDRRVFAGPGDWRGVLPEGFDSFTTSDLASAMGIDRDLAQKLAYCLREASIIAMMGRRGRESLYGVADA
jgi:hypothetical protein